MLFHSDNKMAKDEINSYIEGQSLREKNYEFKSNSKKSSLNLIPMKKAAGKALKTLTYLLAPGIVELREPTKTDSLFLPKNLRKLEKEIINGNFERVVPMEYALTDPFYTNVFESKLNESLYSDAKLTSEPIICLDKELPKKDFSRYNEENKYKISTISPEDIKGPVEKILQAQDIASISDIFYMYEPSKKILHAHMNPGIFDKIYGPAFTDKVLEKSGLKNHKTMKWLLKVNRGLN